MGAFLGCAAVLNVVENGGHGIPRRARGALVQNHHKGTWPLCGGLARRMTWPGRKPSQHSTFFGKIAIFAECCDGFYCKAKTITKVPGPFVVEMTFAQIKPTKINLSLFGRF